MGWLYVHAGLGDAGGSWYLFWSGIGSDLTELAFLGALIGAWRRHNCHQRRCWRIGRYKVDAATIVCRRHHPDPEVRRGLDSARITERYHLYLGTRPGRG